jgi:hypothetical protein
MGSGSLSQAILEAGGIAVEQDMLKRVCERMEGKTVHELIAEGSKLSARCVLPIRLIRPSARSVRTICPPDPPAQSVCPIRPSDQSAQSVRSVRPSVRSLCPIRPIHPIRPSDPSVRLGPRSWAHAAHRIPKDRQHNIGTSSKYKACEGISQMNIHKQTIIRNQYLSTLTNINQYCPSPAKRRN